MTKEFQQQNSDEAVLAELDRFVIEAIDTLIATSKQVKTVRQRQQAERNNMKNKMSAGKVTQLKSRFRAEDETARHPEMARADSRETAIAEEEFEENQQTNDLAGMTPRQREHAEAFASWLMQQDNYPLILQHIEELLAAIEIDFAWNDHDNVDTPKMKVGEQAGESELEPEISENENATDSQK